MAIPPVQSPFAPERWICDDIDNAAYYVPYLNLGLSEARKAEHKGTNFRIGAAIVQDTSGLVFSTGFTGECPGNTHAEESAIKKLAHSRGVAEEDLGQAVARDGPFTLVTTMAPCTVRNSGNLSCTDRLLGHASWISRVVYGVGEPEDFVDNGEHVQRLEGVFKVVHVSGYEGVILRVSRGEENTNEISEIL